MTKIKHPATKADRLRINERKKSESKKQADKTRKRIAESIKEQETADVLRAIRNSDISAEHS